MVALEERQLQLLARPVAAIGSGLQACDCRCLVAELLQEVWASDSVATPPSRGDWRQEPPLAGLRNPSLGS